MNVFIGIYIARHLNWNAYTIKKLAALSARLLVVLKKIAGRQLNEWNGRLMHWRLESRCRWQCLRHRHPSILRNIVICLERMTLLMLLNQLLMNYQRFLCIKACNQN